MNKISKIIIGAAFLAAPFITPAMADTTEPALQSSLVEQNTVQQDANTRIQQISYKGSDALAISDPVGSSPMTAMHDAGPPATHHSYGAGCQDDTCARAEKRWGLSTTWQQDRASGLSLGWGGSQ